jgi:hypothetical protein
MIIAAVAKSKGQRFHFLGQRGNLQCESLVTEEFCSYGLSHSNRLAKVVNEGYHFMKSAPSEGIFGDFH